MVSTGACQILQHYILPLAPFVILIIFYSQPFCGLQKGKCMARTKLGGGADIGSATSEVIMHSMYIVLVIIHISY